MNIQKLRKEFALTLAGTLAIGIASWSTTAAATQISYSGDAKVVGIDVNLLNQPLAALHLVKAGPLAPTGGVEADKLLVVGPASAGPVTISAVVASAATAGNGYEAKSSAFVASVNLGVSTLAISADVLAANTSATCSTAGGATASGNSLIANLVIAGKPITITGQPNQTLPVIPGFEAVTIIVNEQIVSQSGGDADVTVNALHVKVGGPLSNITSADVVISHAHSDISGCPLEPLPCEATNSCQPCDELGICPPCTSKDFVTGGGQTTNKQGKKVSFSTHGGRNKDGSLRNGHLNVVDHGSGGPHISSGVLTNYFDPTPTSNTRTLVFSCGTNVNCTVIETDNGEPGTNDRWYMSRDGGYTAGNVTGSILNGNVQLHKPRGCSAPTPPPPPPKCKGKGCNK